MLLLIFFAILAGLATVLSPCILPVLPAILSASTTGGKKRPFGVIAGLITSFVFFTLALTSLVHLFGFSANVLRYIAIGIIGFFGLVLLLPPLSNWFAKITNSIASFGSQIQTPPQSNSKGFWSGFIIGSALGLVWTPCAGPILAAITTLVATQNVSLDVVWLTIAYSIGAGLPLLLIAYGGHHALTTFPLLVKHTEGIRQVFGVFMILTALALAFNWDVFFQQKVLDYLPSVKLEENQWVKKQLQQLRPTSPYSQQNAEDGVLPLITPAPPIEGITAWINSPPLTIEKLRGKVVLIDFWTYSCINCIRTFPYLSKWYEAYKDQNFVIIGVHTPEFEFEKDESNVKKATERFHLTYPVAMDNNYKTWQAYSNSYWPAHYLIDKNGIIREVHFGEGDYLETENAIRSLLKLAPLAIEKKEETPHLYGMTPETYLGYKRGLSYAPENQLKRDQTAVYSTTSTLAPNEAGLQGDWFVGPESIKSESDTATLSLNFKADRVYLVLGGMSSQPIHIDLDGQPLPSKYWTADMDDKGKILVKDARKYDILNLTGEDGRHTVTLHIPKGIEAFAFTFGGEGG